MGNNWIFNGFVAFFVMCAFGGTATSGSDVLDTKLSPLPAEPDYKAAGTEYDDGGMGGLYNFARSFINSSLPGGFPMEFINGTLNEIYCALNHIDRPWPLFYHLVSVRVGVSASVRPCARVRVNFSFVLISFVKILTYFSRIRSTFAQTLVGKKA